jgi:predicted DNA-binding transcriptional regulator AlpA
MPKRLTAVPAQARARYLLTISEVCDELQIAQSTFYDWRAKGTGPRCIKLPNGQLRVRRGDFDSWLNTREDAA